MSMESSIFSALSILVAGRVYPDLAPESALRPYIVYQQIGGDAVNFLDVATPNKRNAIVQVAVWADTRLQASAVSVQAEEALRLATALQATVMGATISDYDVDTKLRGARQSFSFWI